MIPTTINLLHYFLSIHNIHTLRQVFHLAAELHAAERIDATAGCDVDGRRVDARWVCDGYPVGHNLFVLAVEVVASFVGNVCVIAPIRFRRRDYSASDERGFFQQIANAACILIMPAAAALDAHGAVDELPAAFRKSVTPCAGFEGATVYDYCSIL